MTTWDSYINWLQIILKLVGHLVPLEILKVFLDRSVIPCIKTICLVLRKDAIFYIQRYGKMGKYFPCDKLLFMLFALLTKGKTSIYKGRSPKSVKSHTGLYRFNSPQDLFFCFCFLKNIYLFVYFIYLFCFLGPQLWHMEIPRLRVKSELQLVIAATAIPDPSHVCKPRHS